MSDIVEIRDIRLMSQVSDGFANAGYTKDDINWLRSNGQLLKDILAIRNGRARILTDSHVIDMDEDPFCPDGWQVVSHEKQGKFDWDANKVQLYLPEGQQGSKSMVGTKLQKELENQPTFNANLLDFLREHPGLIPHSWRGKWIFFWKTIYRDSCGRLIVRGLHVHADGSCLWYCRYLGHHFRSDSPAAVASK